MRPQFPSRYLVAGSIYNNSKFLDDALLGRYLYQCDIEENKNILNAEMKRFDVNRSGNSSSQVKEFHNSRSLKSNEFANEAVEDERSLLRKSYYFTRELAWLKGVKTLREIC